MMRRWLRNLLFSILRRLAKSVEAKEMAVETLTGLLDGQPELLRDPQFSLAANKPPYADLGPPSFADHYGKCADPIFITARFRSGSTLLWNLFRHTPGCTAYYEPFNERRWFDPRSRGNRVDGTHKKVEDYWREYDGLPELGQYFREQWIDTNLLMEADFWAPEMKRYIDLLIKRAPCRPVLQFNRVDFRLPWLRRNFPNATLIHLYRHPRDQWCSTLLDCARFPKNAPPAEFVHNDKFYLRRWVSDLKFHFPFLEQAFQRHPYEAFYHIWRLSYIYGTAYADYSICFERLVGDPDQELPKLLETAGIAQTCQPGLRTLIDAPRIGRWRDYAEDAWFRETETRCEEMLADLYGNDANVDALVAPN